MYKLENIDPKFRELTDLLFLTDRMDLQLSDYKKLLKSNIDHYSYLHSRFTQATGIYRENGEQFWHDRFSFLLSLEIKNLSRKIQEYVEVSLFDCIYINNSLDANYDIEYCQALELFKINKKTNNIKGYLASLSLNCKKKKLLNIVNAFIPVVFSTLQGYGDLLIENIVQYSFRFDTLLQLEGAELRIDREKLAGTVIAILKESKFSNNEISLLFRLLDDKETFDLIKKEYNASYRDGLISLIKSASFQILEVNKFINISNILQLDGSVADEVVENYAYHLYRSAGYTGKRSNVNKLVKLTKKFPPITTRKILTVISAIEPTDIKYLVQAFPELKKIAMFV
jgi:hypothetical protein